MADFPIEQALYRRSEDALPELLARSAGFRDDLLAETAWLLTAFGDRPPGVACPSAVFARPLDRQHVAVIQAADQEPDAPGRPAPLGFRVLVLSRDAYDRFLGDPFVLSERLPPAWDARGDLPTLSWPAQPLPPRTVRDVQEILKRLKSRALSEDEDVTEDTAEHERTAENSESPALLGGVQVLVDGGRLVFERPAPDTRLLQGLWTLLPTTTRSHLWPASFAFSNELEFDVLVVPRLGASVYAGYTTEDQAADYPEGRYELRLQMAAEAGDQVELDTLLSRRSWRETWRLGITVLVLFALLALAGRVLEFPARPPEEAAEDAEVRLKQAAVAAGVVGMGGPLNTLGVLPSAQQAWNELRQVPPAGRS
jgi:hypothetical protein